MRGYRDQRRQNEKQLDYKDLKISFKKTFKDYTASELVEDAKKIANTLKISSSQLRKVHGYVSRMWEKYRVDKARGRENFEEIKEKLILLKPRLHYNAVRSGKEYGKLADILEKVIDKVRSLEDFEKFKEFYDAIVAYSKK